MTKAAVAEAVTVAELAGIRGAGGRQVVLMTKAAVAEAVTVAELAAGLVSVA